MATATSLTLNGKPALEALKQPAKGQ